MLRWLMGLHNYRLDPHRMRGCFEGGAGAGAGGSGAGGAGGTGTGSEGDKGGGKAEPFATFQDEASFKARINQASKQEVEKLAKELGFESAKAMQEAAKAKKDADEAAKTELEKEKAAREKAEGEKKTALEAANQRLINAEIKVCAVQAGFVDPADAVALADKAGITVDDAGNVTGAKEAVEKLAKTKPHLVGTKKPDGSPGGTGNSGRQGGGSDQAGDFGKRLAEKRAEEAKKRGESAHNYFK